MKRNAIWIIGAILLLAALLFLPSLFYGHGSMMSGYGMMGNNWMDGGYGAGAGWDNCGFGYGMMGGRMGFFGWLIPIGILILVIAGGVWLGNMISNRNRISSSAPEEICPNCSKSVAADWSTCPYCGTSLK